MGLFLDPDDPDLGNAAASLTRIYDQQAAAAAADGSTVTYRVKKKYFYVLSGNFKNKADQDTTYYERVAISPRCPHIFNRFQITYPKSKEDELSKFVTRLSRSLRATCQGDDAVPAKAH
jgi:hypothetical protein